MMRKRRNNKVMRCLSAVLALAMAVGLFAPAFAREGSYFTDVGPDTAYYDDLKWAANAGVIESNPDGSFGVGRVCTEQEAINMLWRAAGSVNTGIGTTDNERAVSWLERQCGGVLDLFHSSEPITRAGFVGLLYNALGDKVDLPAELSFNDLSDTSETFETALCWVRAKGLFEGVSETEFAPRQQMTREEIVSVLRHCFENGVPYTITEQEFPVYIASTAYIIPLTVAFIDDQTDIPYISVESLKDFMVAVYGDENSESGYSITMQINDSMVTLKRENNYDMYLDFDAGAISFWDYDAFIRASSNGAVMNPAGITLPTQDAEGQPAFFNLLDTSSERYGKALTMNLNAYGLRMIRQDDNYYIPFQTVNDVLFGINGYSFLYNGQFFVLYPDEELEEMFYSVPTGSRSPALALFTYKEPCFALDQFYGLKDQHNISSFADELKMNGVIVDLQSTDPAVSDAALSKLLSYYLDDSHSGFNAPSCYEGMKITWEPVLGPSMAGNGDVYARLQSARDAAFPEGVPAYQEVGDTAYITFNAFKYAPGDYYQTPPEEPGVDTLGLMIYAYNQITREGSPIKNVVLDLSMNLGGDVIAAEYTIGTFLGQSSVSIRNTLTEAIVTENCNVDPSLDRVFDTADSLLNYNLFCLTSPLSFSCGNLVPSVFRSSHLVTILGQTSGGGSCKILEMTTADGARFQISSPYVMSFMKNGSFYDIDQGVVPDYIINSYDHFYDREALTDYIHRLY